MMTGMRGLLQIVVASHCFGCEEASRLSQEVVKTFPQIRVEFIDIEQQGARVPAGIFAVPSYLLNGVLLFTGNPGEAELVAALSAALAQNEDSDVA